MTHLPVPGPDGPRYTNDHDPGDISPEQWEVLIVLFLGGFITCGLTWVFGWWYLWQIHRMRKAENAR